MVLGVKLNDMSWSIPLERRITIVQGDSGTGKTTLINLINESQECGASDIQVESKLPIAICRYDSWRVLMSNARNMLLVFDDLEVVESREFADLISETEEANNYYLIFSRSNLPIKDSSILLMYCENNGLEHKTKPV